MVLLRDGGRPALLKPAWREQTRWGLSDNFSSREKIVLLVIILFSSCLCAFILALLGSYADYKT